MLWFVYFDVLFLFFALLNPHHYLGNLLEVDTVVRVPITGTMDTKKWECSMALITVRNYLDTEPLFEIFLYYLLHHFHVVTLITEQPSLPKGEGFETRSLFISIFSNFSLPCPLQTQHQKEAGEHGGALQAWEVADGRGRRKVRTVLYRTCTVRYVQCSGSVTVWDGSGSLDPNPWIRTLDYGSGSGSFRQWPSRQKIIFCPQFF